MSPVMQEVYKHDLIHARQYLVDHDGYGSFIGTFRAEHSKRVYQNNSTNMLEFYIESMITPGLAECEAGDTVYLSYELTKVYETEQR